MPLLEIEDLAVSFTNDGKATQAVSSVSFSINANETLAVVGESGSGKSVTALSILGLIRHAGGRIDRGSIKFEGAGGPVDLARASEKELRAIRGNDITMVFQEPMTSLNPVFTVGDQIDEVLATHTDLNDQERKQAVLDAMRQVRVPDPNRRYHQYPHELSGGMRQRIMIAMALVCRPKLLIADEPTTALDVTIQSQILWLIRKLKQETGAAVLFITHDLGVVAQLADRVVVMNQGEVVESGATHKVFATPAATYTKNLLASIPILGSAENERSSVDRSPEPLLRVDALSVSYPIGRATMLPWLERRSFEAVRRVSFSVPLGRTLGLVGESGCGKSTIAKAIVGLVSPSAGQITVDGNAIEGTGTAARRAIARQVQMVFQDPFASLSPRRTAFSQVAEPLVIHRYGSRTEIRDRVTWLLERVGLDAHHLDRYPHQFSGGQRQRLCIARALALNPKLVVADEPVSALDVSIQARVLDLLAEIQEEFDISYLFISHDIAVVEKMSDDVAVMYRGQLVEYGSRRAVLNSPAHPYTQRLLESVPVPDPSATMPVPDFVEDDWDGEASVKVESTFREVSAGHFVLAQ